MNKKLNLLGVIVACILLFRLWLYPDQILTLSWKIASTIILIGIIIFIEVGI